MIGETVRDGQALIPVMRLVASGSGAEAKQWRDTSRSRPGAAVAVGARLDDGRAIFAVSSLVDPDGVGKVRPRLSVGPDGRVSQPLLIDAGTTLFVDAAAASRPDEILLRGGIGDQPAIFRRSATPGP